MIYPIKILVVLSLLIPLNLYAGEWRTEVRDSITKEIKYYSVALDEITEFTVHISSSPYATCKIFIKNVEMPPKHKDKGASGESGAITCMYENNDSPPFSAAVWAYLYKSGKRKIHHASLSFLSKPNKNGKSKQLFSITLDRL